MYRFPKTPRMEAVSPSEWETWNRLDAVVEEKVDGANTAIYFEDGKLVLQSRGHVLMGGPRERLFERLHPWAYERLEGLQEALEDRYVAFGEWVFAKHRTFYDALPDLFLVFDVYDKKKEYFLPTLLRRALVAPVPLQSVPLLWQGPVRKAPAFGSFIGTSSFKTDRWHEAYHAAMQGGLAAHYADSETDSSSCMEGVYVKIEDDERVVGRFKILREGYDKVRMDDHKWGRRPLFPNHLRVSHG